MEDDKEGGEKKEEKRKKQIVGKSELMYGKWKRIRRLTKRGRKDSSWGDGTETQRNSRKRGKRSR